MRTSSATTTDFVVLCADRGFGIRSRSARSAVLLAFGLALIASLLFPAAGLAQFGVNGEYRFSSDYTGNDQPGEFGALQSVGINFSGVGGAQPGEMYVLDRGNGFGSGGRLQQYSQAGVFSRLWGTNVVASGPGNANETQMLRVEATGGTYTLTFGGATTAPIPFDASPTTIKTALEALSTIGGVGSTVEVSGGPGDATGSTPYRVVFGGAAAQAKQPLIVPDFAGLTGGNELALVAEINPGKTGFEICEPSRDDACAAAAAEYSTNNFTGGTLSYYPSSVAVDQETGESFVVAFNHVNRYSPSGEFERAFGYDAVFSGPDDSSVDEQQQLTVQATGGTYTLTFMSPCCSPATTEPIPYNWPASDPGTPEVVDSVEEAINRISSVKGFGGWVTVSGGPGDPAGSNPYLINFRGNLAGDDVPQLQSNASELSGTPRQAEVTTTVPGGAPEICIAAHNDACGTNQPSSSTNGGSLDPFDTALAIAPPGAPNAGNILATQRYRNMVVEFTGEGDFVRTFGWDVNKAGAAEFEICKAGEECKNGVGGSAVGQLESPLDIDEDSTGAIYVAEQGANRRVQKFVPSGESLIPSLFGKVNEQQSVTVRATSGSFRLATTQFGGSTGGGSVTNGSPVVSNFTTSTGEFRVGQPISGAFPRGTTIVSVSPGQLVASKGSTTLCFSCQMTSNAIHETADLPASATATEVEAALNALPDIGGKGGSVSVTGGPADATGSSPFVITFSGGAIAGTDPAELVATQGSTPLAGGSGEGANEARVQTTVPAGATGSSGANGPVAVAVGPGDDVYVLKRYQAGAGTCGGGAVSPAESKILILPTDGSTVSGSTPHCGDVPPNPEFGGTERQELVVNRGTGEAFLTQDGQDQLPSGGYAQNRIFTFGDVGGPPELTLNDAEDIRPTGATVSGTITPNGPGPTPYPNPATTKYRVEYKKASASGWELFSGDVPVGVGFGPEPFSIGVGGLEPKTEYQIRVVATKPHGFADVTAVTAPFTTSAAPPLIETFSSSNVTAHSADLNAIINPRGTDSSYRFEYGTTPSYGHSTPEVDIGDSLTGVSVQAHIENLEPRVYHFRVVATNSEGTVRSTNQTFNFYPEECPNATVRQQTGSGALPDCRAYEIVSPGNAGTALLELGGPDASFALSPSRFAFTGSISPIPGPWNPPASLGGVQYVATRTAQGWRTQYVGFPADVLGGQWSNGSGAKSRSVEADQGLDRFLIFPLGYMYSSGPHMFDAEGNDVGRLPTNAAEIPGANVPPQEGGSYGDWELSPSGNHYFFSSANVSFAPGGKTSGNGSLYDNRIATKEVTVASVLAGGDDIPPGPGPNNAGHYLQIPAASRDGSHLLISAPSACAAGAVRFNCPMRQGVLYMRVDGAVTYEVSEGHAVDYEGMTRNGSKVFFTSTASITPDDTDTSRDLYMWSEETGAITRVSSAAPPAGDTDSCNASWTQGCGVEVVPQTGGGVDPNSNFQASPPSDDSIAADTGDIYFYSPEQLVGGAGFPGRRNLYTIHDGQLEYVATLDANRPITRIQVAPDGDFAAFVTASRLTSYDNTTEAEKCVASGYSQTTATDHCLEMYLYEAENRVLRCVSCKLSGERPTADVEASLGGRFMSDDGRTFFSTKDTLVPPDTNEDTDVYEFVNSRPHLITSGAEVGDPYRFTGLLGVSANGVDVFFSTLETLVANDENGRYLKFYTARTNGGFPVTAKIAPCQAADECHGSGSTPATPPGVTSTAGLGGSGDFNSGSQKKVSKPCQKRTRSARKHAKKCRSSRRHARHRGRAGR